MDKHTNSDAYTGRGPNVPYAVDRIIAEEYEKDRSRTAKEVMAEVHKRLGKSQLRPGWPGLSYIQKMLTAIRKKDSQLGLDPRDKPWTVLSLADYDIPPEALPIVMRIQADAIRDERPFTIREALWVGRLYCTLKGTRYEGDAGLLGAMASKYALVEEIRKRLADINRLPDEEAEIWLRRYDDMLLYSFMTKSSEREAMARQATALVWEKIMLYTPQLFGESEEDVSQKEETEELRRKLREIGGKP